MAVFKLKYRECFSDSHCDLGNVLWLRVFLDYFLNVNMCSYISVISYGCKFALTDFPTYFAQTTKAYLSLCDASTHGPSGVKVATRHIRQVLKESKPQYGIRADIKSFYKSIPHHQLIEDINGLYDDPKVQRMLKEIIINPIETPRGYKNADHGIALRCPLSQFFSGIYLKPLDEAFDAMDVTYLRYQDDILILCRSRRQLERCKQRMNSVL